MKINGGGGRTARRTDKIRGRRKRRRKCNEWRDMIINTGRRIKTVRIE